MKIEPIWIMVLTVMVAGLVAFLLIKLDEAKEKTSH